MISTIIIAVLSSFLLIMVCLVILLLRKIKRLRKDNTIIISVFAKILSDIEDSLKQFNEKYDVQLSLEKTTDAETGKKSLAIVYLDPKDGITSPNDSNEQP